MVGHNKNSLTIVVESIKAQNIIWLPIVEIEPIEAQNNIDLPIVELETIKVQNNIFIDLPIVIEPIKLRHKITFDYPLW